MTDARRAIKDEIAERKQLDLDLGRKLEEAEAALAAVREQRDHNRALTEALKAALAAYGEHAPSGALPTGAELEELLDSYVPEPGERIEPESEPAAQEPEKPKRHSRDPLRVNRKVNVRPRKKKKNGGRAPARSVGQRADDVILVEVGETDRARAELLVMAVYDAGGEMTTTALADAIAAVLECNRVTAQTIVTRCLPVAIKQGRLSVDDPFRLQCPYTVRLTPQEAASNRLGADQPYEGTTTRWPRPEDTRKGAKVTEEPSAFESGKKR